MATPFHQQYLALVDKIERRFPVAEWRGGDADLWPLARMDLYLDMYWQQFNGKPSNPMPRPVRAAARAATPLTNLWRRRRDWRHHVLWPHRADAIFLGDGISLDQVGGAWQDRYGEPLIVALERQRRRSFLMQRGALRRQPWHRPTFAANTVEAAGRALAAFVKVEMNLPGHAEVLQLLEQNGVVAPSLSASRMARSARVVCATASVYERILKVVQPRLAFVVTYYADMGHAFVLACRRQGVLCVDLQHCPQRGRHKAYRWPALPANGYTTLPAVFLNWNAEETAHITSWSSGSRWHRGLTGGNPRLSAILDEANPQTRAWTAQFTSVSAGRRFDRDILVALQTIDGQEHVWNALADQIEASPLDWRWWIRRHPASRKSHDGAFARLVSLRRPNVVVEEASILPLPVLLRHMDVVVSLSSGTAAEGAAFGIPAVFLSKDASASFADLVYTGQAVIVDDACDLNAVITALPAPSRRQSVHQPDLMQTLTILEQIANDYRQLCIRHANASDAMFPRSALRSQA